MGCDHSNFLDIFLASHRHTVALMQTHAVAQLRWHIQSRSRLDLKVRHLLAVHGSTFAHRFYKQEAQESSGSAPQATGLAIRFLRLEVIPV